MERRIYEGVCKKCNQKFSYTQTGNITDILHGRSASSRCDDCRFRHRKFITSFGISYLPIKDEQNAQEKLRRRYLIGLGRIVRDIPSPAPIDYPGVPTLELFQKKFQQIETTIDLLVEEVEDPRGAKFILLSLPTGTGKSVYMPYRLLTSKLPKFGSIVVTEPRLSVLKTEKKDGTGTIPWFIGTQLLQSPAPGYGKGFEIGVQYSGESSMVDRHNKLVFMSDGLLIRKLINGELASFSAIVIDEAHEKSVNMATLFTMLKLVAPIYPKLKVIFASATVDPQDFVEYFGEGSKDNIRVIEPVQQITTQGKIYVRCSDYSPNSYEGGGYSEHLDDFAVPEKPQDIPKAAAQIVEAIRTQSDFTILNKPYGDIIIFVPTIKILNSTVNEVKALKLSGLKVYPCHAQLTEREEQRFKQSEEKAKLALECGSKAAFQRVIVGTNYIETGVTILADYVIDGGYILEPRWDSSVCTKNYNTVLISKDKAKQRWGRVGRMDDGEAFCLYSAQTHNNFPDYTASDVTRSSLDRVLLTLKSAGIEDLDSVKIFGIDQDNLTQKQEKERALQVLQKTGSLDADGDLTRQGRLLDGTRTSLVDLALLIVEGERFGTHLEIVTFLAFVERQGQKSLFLDTEQGILASSRWTEGVIDDLEFYLRLFIHWFEARKDESEKGYDKKHRDWSEAQGLNHDTFKEINKQRKQLLKEFQKGVHVSSEVRYFDLARLHRVRVSIARAMSEWLFVRQVSESSLPSFVPYYPDRCSYEGTITVDRDSSCYAIHELEAFICIDRTSYKNNVYAHHVVRVEPDWIPYLQDASLGQITKLIKKSMANDTLYVENTKQRLESQPEINKAEKLYTAGMNVRLLVIREVRKQDRLFYLVKDTGTNNAILAQLPKQHRLAPGDEFDAVVTDVIDKYHHVIVSLMPLIESRYQPGVVLNGVVDKNQEVSDMLFIQIATGINGVLRKSTFGRFYNLFDRLEEGDSLSLQVMNSNSEQGKIELCLPDPKPSKDKIYIGFVVDFDIKKGLKNGIKVEFMPGKIGILWREEISVAYLDMVKVNDPISVYLKSSEDFLPGIKRYVLGNSERKMYPEKDQYYLGKVKNLNSTYSGGLQCFVAFYPQQDGVIYYDNESNCQLKSGDYVVVYLDDLRRDANGKMRYSLHLISQSPETWYQNYISSITPSFELDITKYSEQTKPLDGYYIGQTISLEIKSHINSKQILPAFEHTKKRKINICLDTRVKVLANVKNLRASIYKIDIPNNVLYVSQRDIMLKNYPVGKVVEKARIIKQNLNKDKDTLMGLALELEEGIFGYFHINRNIYSDKSILSSFILDSLIDVIVTDIAEGYLLVELKNTPQEASLFQKPIDRAYGVFWSSYKAEQNKITFLTPKQKSIEISNYQENNIIKVKIIEDDPYLSATFIALDLENFQWVRIQFKHDPPPFKTTVRAAIRALISEESLLVISQKELINATYKPLKVVNNAQIINQSTHDDERFFVMLEQGIIANISIQYYQSNYDAFYRLKQNNYIDVQVIETNEKSIEVVSSECAILPEEIYWASVNKIYSRDNRNPPELSIILPSGIKGILKDDAFTDCRYFLIEEGVSLTVQIKGHYTQSFDYGDRTGLLFAFPSPSKSRIKSSQTFLKLCNIIGATQTELIVELSPSFPVQIPYKKYSFSKKYQNRRRIWIEIKEIIKPDGSSEYPAIPLTWLNVFYQQAITKIRTFFHKVMS